MSHREPPSRESSDRESIAPAPSSRPSSIRRLVVPVVLAVTVIGAIAVVATTAPGCGDNAAPSDGGVDTPIDTPIV